MTVLDPEKQQQAKQYARIKRRLWLVDTAFSALYALAWLAFGWAVGARVWLTSFFANEWLLVPAFAALFGGIYFLLNLPLSYYAEFVLPHRFDQSNQTLKDWIVDQLKGLLIAVPLGIILIEGLYAFLRAFPDTWWLWAAGALLVFQVLLANLAPLVILPLFNKFVPLGDEHAELAERLMKLAQKANTKVQGVFTFDMSRRTKAANAALTGIGNTRRIILGDTLINEFTSDEIETVLAHELGHQVHRDISLLIGLGTITTLVGFYLVSLALTWAVGVFHFNGPADVAALPAFGLVLGVYGLLTMPLENAFSRWRERLADEYALQVTGKKQAFASAFTRLANQNLSEVDPEKWVVFMFYDHPPLNERIKMIETFKSGVS
ncbi:MAG: M48 family metallopeptidase [Anaerolineales bacterium]